MNPIRPLQNSIEIEQWICIPCEYLNILKIIPLEKQHSIVFIIALFVILSASILRWKEFINWIFPGRNLLDWIGLGTGSNTDPYQARTNANCLNGDLAECFKSRALSTFEEFFSNVSKKDRKNIDSSSFHIEIHNIS